MIVSPPKPLTGDPVSELTNTDHRVWKLGAQGFHDLIKRHAHWGLLLVLRESHDIEQRAGSGWEISCCPSEHRIRHRIGVDLPEERQVGQLAGGAVANFLRGVRYSQSNVAAQPGAIHFIADFPSIDLWKGGNVIDKALFVLSAGVLAVVGGIHRLPEDFQPFRFRVVDQGGVGRGRLARIENNADPSKGSGETRREVEIHLVVRNRVDRKTKPRSQARLVVSGKNRAVFLQKGVIGHGQLIERELTGLALAAFGTVGIHTGELRGSCLIRTAKLCGLHIIGPRCKGGIELFPDVPGRLVAEVHRRPGAEPRPAIVENDETKSVRNRRPVESQRHAA